MVTQLEIARQVGLDVSSVNKILNQVKGPVFRKETIKEVMSLARGLGYNFDRKNRHYWQRRAERFEELLRKIMPTDKISESVAQQMGAHFPVAIEIHEALYPEAAKKERRAAAAAEAAKVAQARAV